MAVVSIDWDPKDSVLAGFSEVAMFAIGMVAAPLALARSQATLGAALWAIAVAIRVAGLLRPRWLRPIYLGLSVATFPIGWVVSNLAIALVYFLVFTPIALAFRLIGRDALARRFDRGAPTYWEAYNPRRDLERYFRPF
jgi:hypothetical protein